jgi:hypothetical protein
MTAYIVVAFPDESKAREVVSVSDAWPEPYFALRQPVASREKVWPRRSGRVDLSAISRAVQRQTAIPPAAWHLTDMVLGYIIHI